MTKKSFPPHFSRYELWVPKQHQKMAAAVLKFGFSSAKCTKDVLITNLIRPGFICSVTQKLQYSGDASKSIDDRPDWVVLADGGKTVVCWHPEQEFPYECSKPLPVLDSKLQEGDSVLKIQYRLDHLNRNYPKGPDLQQLMKLTYTNKHRWYPNNNKRYRKPNPPVDREGL